jgi:glycosyltransferase involved in cell wall biosynthesis
MSIISNDLYEKKLIINGLNNAKKYTWANTANQTLKIYNQL